MANPKKLLVPVQGLLDKGSQLFNVKAYGAKGDGTTDDTTAVQAALTAAASVGGEVLVPQGTFIIANVTIGLNVTVRGTGRGSILKAKTGTTGSLIALTTPSTGRGIVIKNLSLDGNNLASLSGIVLDNTSVGSDSLHRLSTLWISNFKVDGVKLGAAVIESVLENIYVYNSGRYGYNFDVGATDNRIINCSSGLSLSHGFYIQGNNNHFIGCKAFYAGYTGSVWTAAIHGFMLYPSASQDLRFVSLVSCEAQNNSVDGFHVDSTASTATVQHISITNCIADGNNMYASGGNGFYLEGTEYSALNGNTTRSQTSAHVYGLAMYGSMTGTAIGNSNDFQGATAPVYVDSGVTGLVSSSYALPYSVVPSNAVGGIDAPFGTSVARAYANNGFQIVTNNGAVDFYVKESGTQNNVATFHKDSLNMNGYPISNIADDAYNATSWNGNTDVPTKNAVRDKLEASAITIAGSSTPLGGTITQDTITGLSSTGIIKRTGSNALAIATARTDYQPATTVSTSAPGSPSNGDLWWDTDDTTDYGLLSNGTELRAYMQASSKVPYPASDITGYTSTTTAPTYSGAKSVLFNDANAALHFRYSGTWYNFSGNGMNQINGATSGSSAAWSSYEVEFYVNGADVTFWSVQAGVQSDYRIFVDDMPMTLDWQLNSAVAYDTMYAKIVFATSRMRKIRIFGSGLATFTGIILPGASDIWAAPPRFRMAIIGDSYIQGGHDGGTEGFVTSASLCNQIAALTGWEVMNMGQGSTGYINNASNTGGKDYYGASSRMTALAALPALDLIMVYGSGNDSSQTSGAVTTAVNSLWNAIKAARPTTPIVVAGIQPGSPAGFTPSLLDSTNTTIKNAAAANANVAAFIDMRASGDNWVTGTGNAGAPTYDGNSDFFIGPDTVHPTRTGYSNMAWRMVQALGKVKV